MTGNSHSSARKSTSIGPNGGWLLLALFSAVCGFSGVLFGETAITIVGLLGGIAASTGLSHSLRTRKPTETTPLANSQRLLTHVSHEIRTPIASILGFAELLEDATPENRTSYRRTIERNGEHVLRLLDDILDHAQIEAGVFTVKSAPTDITSLASEISDTLTQQAKQKGLTLSVNVCPEMPFPIATDSTRLRQVLCNLVVNAIKFTNTGQVIVNLDYCRHDARLICRVEDTGIGMPAHVCDRIFDAFHQVSDTEESLNGTGLGLHISRGIAHSLGGSLTVESKEGVGSTFTLQIPITDACPAISTVVNATDVDLAERRILLAEDCPDNRRLLSCLLQKCGAQVDGVGNGQEALQMIRSGDPPDLVILDMQMPVLNGLQASRRLRENGYRGPILSLSAHAVGDDINTAWATYATAFLAKPIRREVFLKVVSQLLAGDFAHRLAG